LPTEMSSVTPAWERILVDQSKRQVGDEEASGQGAEGLYNQSCRVWLNCRLARCATCACAHVSYDAKAGPTSSSPGAVKPLPNNCMAIDPKEVDRLSISELKQ
jgi:hypothetical protein